MATKLTIMNEKGGVGKSSMTMNVAWELSKKKKVLIIDLDGQRANITYYCGVNATGKQTLMNVFNQECRAEDTIIQVKDNLDIIPANVANANISDQTAKISTMRSIMKELDKMYDYILIDVNPAPNRSHSLCLSVVDHVIIVMNPDIASLKANLGIIDQINDIIDYGNPNLHIMGLLLNEYNGRTRLAKETLKKAEAMAAKLGTSVFKTKVRNAVSLSENIMNHVGITDYDPSSKAADDIRALVAEIKDRAKAS